MSNAPLLSIVIPVAEGREWPERCVHSADESLRKTNQPWELVIKNTGGHETLYSAGRYRMCVDIPRPMFDSWNECVRISSGQYVHILHDDDYVRPDFYPRVIDEIKRHHPFGIVTGYEVEQDGQPTFENRIKRDGGQLTLADLERGNPLVPSCVVLNRSVYGARWYRDIGCCDWDFYLRCHGDIFGLWSVIPEYLVRQVRHADSQEAKDGRLGLYAGLLEVIESWEERTGRRMLARETYFQSAMQEATATGDVDLFNAARNFLRCAASTSKT